MILTDLQCFLREKIPLLQMSAQVASVQVCVQAIGFITGILIIRALDPEKYALYTLAYTLLGTMNVLADSGISQGVMAQGGKVWKSRSGLGAILVTGLKLRRYFALGAIVVTLPFFSYLLYDHDASWTEFILLQISILPLFYIQLSESLLRIVPALHQRIKEVQRISLVTTLIRLAAICLTLLLLPYASAIVIASGLSAFWGNLRMRRLAESLCDTTQGEDSDARSEVLTIVKRTMPGSIYYCLSGSLAIWLISVFGDTKSLASIGALGRISQLMLLFSTTIALVFIPRFARLPAVKSLLLIRFFQIQLLTWSISISLVAVFFIAPDIILLLLGDAYSSLSNEVVLQSLVMATTFINLTLNRLASARGWILHPLIHIPLAISLQITGIVIFDCSTVSGVLLVSLLPQVVLIGTRTTYVLIKIFELKSLASN